MDKDGYKPDIVIYHHPCDDGFGAAWAAWMRWRDDVHYISAAYGQACPDVAGKHVLIVDFSYKRDVLREMAKSARSIIVLDHHKTAQADLADWAVDDVAGDFWAGDNPMKSVRHMDEYVGHPIAALFDMNKSGARMAWEFCHDSEAPDLIKLIEDRDLWRFSMEDTKAFSLWLRSSEYNFEEWELISQQLHDGRDRDRIMTEASAMKRFYDQKIVEMAQIAHWTDVGGHSVPTVNCPGMFASDVCHELLSMFPAAPFVASFHVGDGYKSFSLRSQDHRADVSAIAASFGGGGHRNAAGFRELPPPPSDPRP